jgi:hypothetical protein
VLPALPSNKKNSFDHHNFYNKGPNLARNGLLESPLNFPSIKKVSKNPITKWNRSCVPKILKFHIWNSHSFRGKMCLKSGVISKIQVLGCQNDKVIPKIRKLPFLL